VNGLALSLLGALLATNQPLAVSNVIVQETGIHLEVANPNDPVEREYAKLLEDDDAAQTEANRWIQENDALAANGAGVLQTTLALRIQQRLKPVRTEYESFLQRHTNHVRARLAFGSFLEDIHDEEGAVAQWEKARELDPKNPAAWNNLANFYGHRGPVTNAFVYYEQAIQINPREPVYYQNLATTVFLFRKDAKEFYHLTEQQVFDRAIELYGKALKLNPLSFVLASELAETYYGIKPTRFKEALEAWNYALKVAKGPEEREGARIHLARFKMMEGKFVEARQQLAPVTNAMYAELKRRLLKNIDLKETQEQGTNAPAGTPSVAEGGKK
jgi:tetratricopeptide (TPR) repeat protein